MRAYWYDGSYAASHPSAGGQRSYHEALADVPGLQLRLGHLKESTPTWHRAVLAAVQNCGVTPTTFAEHFTFRSELRQKGVDTKLVLDKNARSPAHDAPGE